MLLLGSSGLLGLLVGSFLNVVIWRVPRGESIVRPGSHCPACRHTLSPSDNVPLLSWLLLRARCRYCGERIGWRYPAIEALTAGMFVAFAWRIGPHPALPAYLYLAAVGIALALIDIDVHRLPNSLTLPSYGVGVISLTAVALVEHEPGRLLQALIGMCAMYGLYLLLVVARPGGMGWGDVKLAGVVGLFLGFLGWGPLVVGGFLAFLLGGVFGVALIATRRANPKTKIPFGPYMIAAAFIAVLAGQSLAHWYVHSTIG